MYPLSSTLLCYPCVCLSRESLADNPSRGPGNGRIRCIPLQDLRDDQIHALAHCSLVVLRVGGPAQVAQASEQGLRGGPTALYRRHADSCAVGRRQGEGGELEGAGSGAEGGVDKGYWGVELVRGAVWWFGSPLHFSSRLSTRCLSFARTRTCEYEIGGKDLHVRIDLISCD